MGVSHYIVYKFGITVYFKTQKEVSGVVKQNRIFHEKPYALNFALRKPIKESLLDLD